MSRSKKIADTDFIALMEKEFKIQPNTKALGEALGISKKTCQRYLKELGWGYPKGRPAGSKSKNKLTGGMAEWIRSHPEEKLSLKVTDIVTKTGLSLDQVKCFLYRIKKEQRDKVKALGDIRKYPGGVRGSRGTLVRFADMKEYSIKFNPFSEDLKVKALLKNNEHIEFKATLSLLGELKKN